MDPVENKTGPKTLADLSRLSQQVSDIYAVRFGIDRDAAWHLGKLCEELGELQSAWLKSSGRGRGDADKSALEDEVADLFAQILLFANWQEIDIEAAVTRKWLKYLPEETR
ncbi:MAG: MazG nucleotide pyrophosphohydrolase domain-containing protein [Pseudomonadota bacterium]